MIITFVLLVNESETSVGEAEQILKDLIDTNSLGLTDLNGDPLTVDSSSYKAVINKKPTSAPPGLYTTNPYY